MKVIEGTYEKTWEHALTPTTDLIWVISSDQRQVFTIEVKRDGKFHNPYGTSTHDVGEYRIYYLEGTEIIHVEDCRGEREIDIRQLLKDLRASPEYVKL